MSNKAESARPPFNAEQKAIVRRFVFPHPADLFASIDAVIARLNPPLSDTAKSFRANIWSAIVVASIPFAMTQAAVYARRFQALLIAQRIRARKDSDSGANLSSELQTRAYNEAIEKLKEESESESGSIKFQDQIVEDLGQALRDAEFNEAAQELIRQTLVMVWGAFEVFVSDTVRSLVNEHPYLAAKLLSSEQTRRHFPTKGVQIDTLVKHEFNVARLMGNVLFEDRQFDSLPVIRDVLSVLLPGNGELHTKLGDEALWTLWQRRHLIVHRRGIVDQAYVSKTPEKATLGSRLELDGPEFDRALILVIDIVVSMLDAIASGSLASRNGQ